jgi:glycerate-2-kinase
MINMKSDVLKLFRTAIGAVDPYACVKHHLVLNNNNHELHIGDDCIILNHNLYVAAFGKAALGRKEFRLIVNQMFLFFLIRHVSSGG